MPIETAATSSSRSAIHARPSRESRTRMLTNSVISTITKIVQYHGLSWSSLNVPMPGKYGASTPLIPILPAVNGIPTILMSVPLIANTRMISPNASVTIAM